MSPAPSKTIGELITEHAVAVLTTGLPGVLVCNQRVRPFEPTELPAVNVKMGLERVTYPTQMKRTAPVADRELHLMIRLEAAGDPPATDPLRVLAIQTLMADRSLGALALGIEEVESQWEDEAGSDATYGVLIIDFAIRYLTAANDPTAMMYAGPAGPVFGPAVIHEADVVGLVADLAARALKSYVDSQDAAETARALGAEALAEVVTHKGALGGYAGLDSGGHVPLAQLPASIVGALQYQGVWDASANSPALASGVGTKGFFYKVSVAGNTALDGNTGWHIGDLAIFDGSVWDKVDNYEAVTSVAGRTGAVVIAESDVAGLTGDLATLAGAISAETTRAEAAESTNATAIATETTRAEAAEALLASPASVTAAVATETARATAAEGVVATAVTTERTRATAAESALALPTGSGNKVLATPADGSSAAAALRSLAQSDLPNLVSLFANLPNLKFVTTRSVFTAIAANYDLPYTVPAGRRAIFLNICANTSPVLNGNSFSNGLFNLTAQVKIGGVYYQIGPSIGLTQGAPNNSAAMSGMYVAEAGETLAVQPVPQSIITSVANVVAGVALTLSSVVAPVNGLTIYVGTITGGGSNALVGRTFVVSGFTNAGNNGTFRCVASTATTLTLVNLAGVAETNAGTATGPALMTYTCNTSVGSQNAGNIVQISGFTNAGNNGNFIMVSQSGATFVAANPNGVAETHAATFAFVGPFAVVATIIEFDNTSTLRSPKLLSPAAGTNILYTPSGSKNGLLVNSLGFPALSGAFIWASLASSTVGYSPHYLPAGPSSFPLTSASAAAGGLTRYSGTIFGGGLPAFFPLTSCAAASGGKTVYTGSGMSPGNSGQYIGMWFLVTGFSNAANNGLFQCVDVTTNNTITLVNPNGVLQTAQLGQGIASPYKGAQITITGFSNAGNNGTFTCVASTEDGIIVSNSGGVAETAAGTATTPSIPLFSNRLLLFATFNVSLISSNVIQELTIANGDSLAIFMSAAGPGGIIWCNVVEF
jgi:hypothetical protein